MKIIDFLNNNRLAWTEESYDIWIDPNGKIYDLGDSLTHLTFVKESIDGNTEIKSLIESGWVKITNSKNLIFIETNSNSLKLHRNLILNPILERAKNSNFILEIKISDNIKENISIKMPENLSRLNLI